MKAIYRSDYPAKSKKTGEYFTMFVYVITKSTEDEMNAYKRFLASKGYEAREDNGQVIYQTPDYAGDEITIGISPTSGIPYVDKSAMNKARSLAKQYGASEHFKQSIATSIAQSVASDILGKRVSANTTVVAGKVTEEVEAENGEDAL